MTVATPLRVFQVAEVALISVGTTSPQLRLTASRLRHPMASHGIPGLQTVNESSGTAGLSHQWFHEIGGMQCHAVPCSACIKSCKMKQCAIMCYLNPFLAANI